MAQKEKNLVDEAYEIIRQKICDFELVPGQPVSDFILSKSLCMSRTPIRMALQRLEVDRLVEPGAQGQSYAVSRITAEDIADLFDARCGLEIACLRLFMSKPFRSEALDRLNEINERMREEDLKGRIRQQFYYDQKFHDQLVQLSGNFRLNRFNSTLTPHLTRLRVLSYFERSYQLKAYNEHHSVIRAIAENDEERAVLHLKEHIASTKYNYILLLKNRLNTESVGVLSYAMTHDRQIDPEEANG